MNACLPCIHTRDADRYAEEMGRATAIEIELERISEEAANEIHEFVKRRFGKDIWSQRLYGLADEVARAQLGARQ